MSSSYRKKSGRPVSEDYINPLFLHSLSRVVAELNKAFPHIMISPSVGARQLFDFITLMDVSIFCSCYILCFCHFALVTINGICSGYLLDSIRQRVQSSSKRC